MRHPRISAALTVVLCTAILAACGGGSDNVASPPPPPPIVDDTDVDTEDTDVDTEAVCPLEGTAAVEVVEMEMVESCTVKLVDPASQHPDSVAVRWSEVVDTDRFQAFYDGELDAEAIRDAYFDHSVNTSNTDGRVQNALAITYPGPTVSDGGDGRDEFDNCVHDTARTGSSTLATTRWSRQCDANQMCVWAEDASKREICTVETASGYDAVFVADDWLVSISVKECLNEEGDGYYEDGRDPGPGEGVDTDIYYPACPPGVSSAPGEPPAPGEPADRAEVEQRVAADVAAIEEFLAANGIT